MTNGFNIELLLDSLADRVAARLGDRLAESNGSVQQRLLSVAEAARYLGRSKTGVQHLISDRAIAVVRHDRRVFLDVRDLDCWIDAAKS